MATRRDWLWPDIKAALEKAGTDLRRLSVSNGYTRAAAAQVKTRPWPNLQALIAQAISKRPQDIWPSRYDAHGNPIRRRHPNTVRTRGNVETGEAA